MSDDSKCPHCDYPNTGAMGIDHDDKPSPGDASICIECGGISVFDQNLRLIKATSDQYNAIMQNPVVQRARSEILGRMN